MFKLLSFVAAGLLAGNVLAQSPDYVWWEAEKPAATTFEIVLDGPTSPSPSARQE